MRWTTICAWLVACDGSDGVRTDEERVDDIVALEADAAAGAEVFAAQCAACHGADGSGAEDGFALAGADVRGVPAADVITNVVLPPVGMLTFDSLPDQSIADVAAHVEGLPGGT